MPEPSRLYRRIIKSNVPTRVVAHLSVVALVAAASVAGFANTQGHDGGGPSSDSGFLSLVSRVHGAAEASAQAPSISYDTEALTEEQATLIDRGAPGGLPGETPLAMPIPVDPDATPLAAPTDAGSATAVAGTGSTTTGPTTRAAVPAPAPAALVWPVPGGSVSQYYHAGHLALDVAAPYGATVVAAQSGVVTWSGWRNNGGGNVISINHGNGMTTVYNHLNARGVSSGQYVTAGQAIGAIGCTGICTGPHLHFEVIVNGVIDNPLRYL